MILAFPASRRGYFKVTGPVINEALRRGHRVLLHWTHDKKPGESVNPVDLTKLWPQATIIPGPNTCDVFIGPSLHTHDLRGWGLCKKVSLDYCWEQANAPLRPDLIQCYVTPYQRAISRGTGPVIGSPQFDAWDDVKAYPHTKPFLLVFAAKFGHDAGLRRMAYKWIGYHQLLRRLRKWCDTEGYGLVVKSREKNRDPYFVRDLANVVLDEDLYPPTSLALIKSATVGVHFQSGALLEMAWAGIPQYAVRLPQPHLKHFITSREAYSGDEGTIARWSGVVHVLNDGNPVPYVLSPYRHATYKERYLGTPGAASRVLDLIEALL